MHPKVTESRMLQADLFNLVEDKRLRQLPLHLQSGAPKGVKVARAV